ncbi:hypothetical protein [Blastococcus sp. CT_GayMR16]|uniref:hypothetical protein n=1 Tax=Blastococcus sp. CT_GayMR16 TaxID=2559607 RepID=UPI0010733DD3|nr:hypothetical protein [Blastococcus sp. CT_GayMR16]TFV89209.1 hypothetical protein E4P38_08710 [Blastococcus sp. CT_GayMR16]
MLTPSADTFAALARSSPWRWSTLRFTVRRGRDERRVQPIRAWLRRPDLLRVETLDGELHRIVREAPERAGVLHGDGGVAPVLRPDGLVAERPRVSYDAPMLDDYRWVALLDPVELADGIDHDSWTTAPPLVVDSVTEVEHAGRPAWEAVVRTTPAYEPRCGCCSLLRSREVDVVEYRDYPEHLLSGYPDAYRVRLDVGTGVCVFTDEIGIRTPGGWHDLAIEAVDEPMADELFVEPPRRLFRRP